jgi:Raf kinase inhibitor-like YbhB/YbcL family protein
MPSRRKGFYLRRDIGEETRWGWRPSAIEKMLAKRSNLLFLLAFVLAAGRVVHAQQKLIVDSPTLKAGAMMPRDYTPDGRNVSPPLTWSDVPAGTREFAVVCEDFDAGNPPPFVHWVIYKIPGTAKGLPENIPIDTSVPMPAEVAGAVQGLNGFKRAIYRGPAPPPGKPHGYHFVVYALDAPLDLKPNLTRAELLEAIKGHVLAQGEIVPVYERKALAKP